LENDIVKISLTLSEYIRIHGLPPCVLAEIDELQNARAEVAREYRRTEILEEQIYHARELLDTLENWLKDANSGKQAREYFARACDNSSF